MTRNITLKIQPKFCGTSWSQALMHLRRPHPAFHHLQYGKVSFVPRERLGTRLTLPVVNFIT